MIIPFENEIVHGDTLENVKKLPDESIDCVITSPPYWQLRDYGYPEQWGLEPTYQEYLEHLWSLMDEIWRVLKPEGTVWINLGDTYSMSGGQGNQHKQAKVFGYFAQRKVKDIPPKSLCLIPHRFAIGCQERGWIIRNDIKWIKENGMPESVTDRFSKKSEYFFFMVKSRKYYFDLEGIREPYKQASIERALRGVSENNKWINGADGQTPHNLSKPRKNKTHTKNYGVRELGGQVRDNHDIHDSYNPNGKNPGEVNLFWRDYKNMSLDEYLGMCVRYYYGEGDFWNIPTKPSRAKHYATFNTTLITKPIVAGCPEGGIVLDPFCGTGTTLVRSLQLNRKIIGIDGNKEYCETARENIEMQIAQTHLFDKLVNE